MYSCLGIVGNIFSVRAHAVNKLSANTIFCKNHVPTENNPPPPNSNILQRFKTDSFFIDTALNNNITNFFISIFVLRNNYIVVLSQQSVDWMFDISFPESGTSTCSPIYSKSKKHPISAKIHKSEAVYFLISNGVSGICSRYISLV